MPTPVFPRKVREEILRKKMKRQRGNGGGLGKMKKKGKTKGEVEEGKEERRDGLEQVASGAAEVVMDWDERLWWWSVADEQRSFRCPFWEVEIVGEAYSNVIYGDVLWDDDIWNLKGIQEVPSP